MCQTLLLCCNHILDQHRQPSNVQEGLVNAAVVPTDKLLGQTSQRNDAKCLLIQCDTWILYLDLSHLVIACNSDCPYRALVPWRAVATAQTTGNKRTSELSMQKF